MAWPFNTTESFPSHPSARSHQLCRATLWHLPHTFWEFSLGVSCLRCYLVGGRLRVEVGVVPGVLQVPPSQLCICSHWCHSKSSFLALHGRWESGSWTSIRFLVTAQTMNIGPCCNGPQDPQRLPWTTDIHMASAGRAGFPHQYGPLWYLRRENYSFNFFFKQSSLSLRRMSLNISDFSTRWGCSPLLRCFFSDISISCHSH